MKSNSFFIFLFFTLSFTLISFDDEDPFYRISKKDVLFKIPKGFPKPNYDFKKNKITPEGFVLGRKLFYDPILSLDGTISCGSCHQQYAAFAHIDHALSHGIKSQIGKRNVSALQNLVWNTSFMWDGGVNHIEIQPLTPITSKVEMAETIENVLIKLRSNPEYKLAFYKAFQDSSITSEKILKSLTQFMGLMVSAKSRYDKYVFGKGKYSNEEKKGLDLFRVKCASCHKEPLFTDQSFRNNGIGPNPRIDDKGREMISGNENDRFKFKVPSLRNIALTYPYMHDGRFKNLTQVLNYYSDSSNYKPNVDKALLGIGPLSKTEKLQLEAFLKTLTDKTFVYDRRFADPDYRRKR